MLTIQITYPYHPQEITALEWTVSHHQVKFETLESVTIWTISI